MTKEDKQIIERGIKENWRIGDRSRLKRLLEKNLKLYRENVELENENRLFRERCNQLLKDKGELTDKIADIKANCDLAIEGRDIKISELEQEIDKMNCLNEKIIKAQCLYLQTIIDIMKEKIEEIEK